MHVWIRRHQNRGGDPAQTRRMMHEARLIDLAAPWRHPRKRAGVLWHIANDQLQQQQLDDAERTIRDAIAVLHTAPLERYGFMGLCEGVLGSILFEKRRIAEAEPLLIHSYQDLLRAEGPVGLNTVVAMGRLIELFALQGRVRDADAIAIQMMRDTLTGAADGNSYNRAAWRVVRTAGLSATAYDLAHEAAQRAAVLKPQHGPWLNTLGVAQYRLGRYREALATLTEADARSDHALLEDAAFLAMSHHHLGQPAEAAAAFERMRTIAQRSKATIKLDRWPIAAEAAALLKKD
jgi:tetratricopeptide (TPR) repeat protein